MDLADGYDPDYEQYEFDDFVVPDEESDADEESDDDEESDADEKSQKPRCIRRHCRTHAHYNFPGQQPQFCAKHSEIGMKLNPMHLCQHHDCKAYAIYTDIKHKKHEGIYCDDDVPLGQEHRYASVLRDECRVCGKILPSIVNGKCGQCFRSKRIRV